MNKTELAAALARAASMSKSDAQLAVECLFDPSAGIIARTLQKNRKVRITGFGTFETRQRDARIGRNPRTGEKIRIPASRAAAFRSGSGLKAGLN